MVKSKTKTLSLRADSLNILIIQKTVEILYNMRIAYTQLFRIYYSNIHQAHYKYYKELLLPVAL
jgi:hypothetical protein